MSFLLPRVRFVSRSSVPRQSRVGTNAAFITICRFCKALGCGSTVECFRRRAQSVHPGRQQRHDECNQGGSQTERLQAGGDPGGARSKELAVWQAMHDLEKKKILEIVE